PAANISTMLEGFPLTTRFSIPFADIDMMQHVNNVAYIRWAETMRAEYHAQVMKTPINGDRGMIQATINFTYERQLVYREHVAIGIRIPRVGNKSFDFYYEIWSVTHGYRAAHGITTMVAYDFVHRRTIEILPDWRTAIAAYEAGPAHEYI
ncbi:MAG: acyl-CoA thioesterase, partial [Vulcanimicrobiaceae bacterium]